jgi:hypothetical protein
LHIVRDGSSVHDAAVLAGIYNSSAYQAIVDSLPPGSLRAEDLLTIGTPKLEGPCRQIIAASSMELALLVHELVTQDGPRFLLLADRLRQDVTLPVSCGRVGELQVPVDPVAFVELYRRDTGQLLERVGRYRALRETIDRALEDDLAGQGSD